MTTVLSHLIADLPLHVVRGRADITIADIAITDLADDSRRATPGCLFIARPAASGSAHGLDHLDAVLTRKPAAILTDRLPPDTHPALKRRNLIWLLTDRVDHALCSRLAERFFDHPARKLAIAAVTGTNGKTTVSFVVQHLLAAAGWRCGLMGTVFIDDGRDRRPAALTTPGPIDISRTLAAMVARGCRAAALEASSHALDQGRLAALQLRAAVFTNLSGDHLDYHKTMDAYAAAKARIFDLLAPDGCAVVNAADPYAQAVTAPLRQHHSPASILWCDVQPPTPSAPGSAGGSSTLTNHNRVVAHIEHLAADHSRVRFVGPWGDWPLRLPLIGRHNVANALHALAAAWSLLHEHAPDAMATLPRALETAPQVPGRLERVQLPTQRGGQARPLSARPTPNSQLPTPPLPTVLVDYAHTDDALDNVLSALRPVTPGRLICVFGCGGDRDRTKRPRMAAVAARLADRVYITSDNPRTEDPQTIISQIVEGIPTDSQPRVQNRVHVDPDRAAAIAAAIHDAGPDDVVLIAGKGHEDYQIVGTTKHHFDDREQAAAALQSHPIAPPSDLIPDAQPNAVPSAPTPDSHLSTPSFTPALLVRATAGRWLTPPADLHAPIRGFSIDSRDIQPGMAFVAIVGPNHDGHDHVAAAFRAGAALAVVQRPVALPDELPGRPVLQVDDTIAALQRAAAAWRDCLALAGVRVIAVTGSNGKTTTRCLIHAALSSRLRGSQSPKSFNNHLGLPLTLLNADPRHHFVVAEVGTNHPGEIEPLARIARPDVAVITTIGTAHIGNFTDQAAIAREKAQLLTHLAPHGIAVLPADDACLSTLLRHVPAGCTVSHFGRAENADPRLLEPVHTTSAGIRFTISPQAAPSHSEGADLTLTLPLPGPHNALNALAALAVARALHIPDEAAITALAAAAVAPMRGQVLRLGSPVPVTLLLDAYNANPDSMRAALDTLLTFTPAVGCRRIAILGDMLELGEHAVTQHRELGRRLAVLAGDIHDLVLIGKLSQVAAAQAAAAYTGQHMLAVETWLDDLPAAIAGRLRPGDVVLIKASRGLALERLVPAIETRFGPAQDR